MKFGKRKADQSGQELSTARAKTDHPNGTCERTNKSVSYNFKLRTCIERPLK